MAYILINVNAMSANICVKTVLGNTLINGQHCMHCDPCLILHNSS